jgi:hypothetical protein
MILFKMKTYKFTCQNEDMQIHIDHLVLTYGFNGWMVVWCNPTDTLCNSTVFKEQQIRMHMNKLEGFCHNFTSNHFTVSMCNKYCNMSRYKLKCDKLTKLK